MAILEDGSIVIGGYEKSDMTEDIFMAIKLNPTDGFNPWKWTVSATLSLERSSHFFLYEPLPCILHNVGCNWLVASWDEHAQRISRFPHPAACFMRSKARRRHVGRGLLHNTTADVKVVNTLCCISVATGFWVRNPSTEVGCA